VEFYAYVLFGMVLIVVVEACSSYWQRVPSSR